MASRSAWILLFGFDCHPRICRGRCCVRNYSGPVAVVGHEAEVVALGGVRVFVEKTVERVAVRRRAEVARVAERDGVAGGVHPSG